MAALLGVGFLAGLVTAISPCILPVLPVIFAGASTGSRRRSVAIVLGLVASFAIATLFGVAVLSALHLPQALLNDVGYTMLLLLAVALVIDPIGDLLERPFARLSSSPRVGASTSSGLLLGAGLGLVFVPCAGLILSAISAVAATHRFGPAAVALTAAYAAGVAVPLLAFALLSNHLVASWAFVREHARAVRRGSGVVIGAMAVVILTGAVAGLQTAVPGYASAIVNKVPSGVESQLRQITGEHPNRCATAPMRLVVSTRGLCLAPDFTGITTWLNTPGNRPLTLAQLRGKVVLVDFWTYSCINCRRSLPHVEAWYRAYRRFGLVVVGVHTPEFAFEHDAGNVTSAAGNLGVRYPVAIDNNYATWYAYANQSWPAEYLIDQHGYVRHTAVGEGDYAQTEHDIRRLLIAGGARHLPKPTDIANTVPTIAVTPESYLGYDRLNNALNSIVNDAMTTYQLPGQLPFDALAFGGNWDVHSEEATAGPSAVLELNFYAHDVYLVLGGTGTATVSLNGGRPTTIHVHGIPNLYTMHAGTTAATGVLTMHLSAGVHAYDFTFG